MGRSLTAWPVSSTHPRSTPTCRVARTSSLLSRLDGAGAFSTAEAVEEALDQAGLAAHADKTVAGYSAGMRQRLGLAAALLRSPRLLLLDEPTSSLDPAGTRDVRTLLERLAHQGTSVVLSSHDMSEVEEICDAVTILHLGHVVFSGTMDELRDRAPASIHALRTSNDADALRLAIGPATCSAAASRPTATASTCRPTGPLSMPTSSRLDTPASRFADSSSAPARSSRSSCSSRPTALRRVLRVRPSTAQQRPVTRAVCDDSAACVRSSAWSAPRLALS